jgi:hypothetical protein
MRVQQGPEKLPLPLGEGTTFFSSLTGAETGTLPQQLVHDRIYMYPRRIKEGNTFNL